MGDAGSLPPGVRGLRGLAGLAGLLESDIESDDNKDDLEIEVDDEGDIGSFTSSSRSVDFRRPIKLLNNEMDNERPLMARLIDGTP